MTDLIDRQEAIEILASAYEFFEDDMDIDNARYAAERVFAYVPSAERRGKWKRKGKWYVCSECGTEMPFTGVYDKSQRFCFNCGARMEE